MKDKCTADEMLAIARKGRPNVRYAKSSSGSSIGAWSEELGRFVCVAGKLVNGSWASLPYELLVDGKPPPVTWVE